MRILVIEDNQDIAANLGDFLEDRGHTVDFAADGITGLHLAVVHDFDAIVLDLNLPGLDGLEVCRKLRNEARKQTPVLVLTARDSLQDRVAGLDSGADDYLIKPFAFAELLARTRALVRRGRVSETPRLTVADLEMDLVTRKVTRGAAPVDLTVREFELLEYLMRYHGQVVSRETLARDVWKETARTTPLDNVIDVHIARLRRKVDADERAKLIHTIRGVGFMLREGEP
jgi:DNA-binding response OmpR family regulator